MSCELGLKQTTGPTGGTQHREHWGGPTNGRAAACRRRLAIAPRQQSLHPPKGSSDLAVIIRIPQSGACGLGVRCPLVVPTRRKSRCKSPTKKVSHPRLSNIYQERGFRKRLSAAFRPRKCQCQVKAQSRTDAKWKLAAR